MPAFVVGQCIEEWLFVSGSLRYVTACQSGDLRLENINEPGNNWQDASDVFVNCSLQ